MERKEAPVGPDPAYEQFKREIADLTGVDLNMYKPQIHRRVHTLMASWGQASYAGYLRLISSDAARRRAFLDYLTINVTEFFRNPARWTSLREDILPGLRELKPGSLLFWSAGCSTGEEAYSLALLGLEARVPVTVIASDIDEGVLKKAREGLYREEQLKNVQPESRRRHFIRREDGQLQVAPSLREKVLFQRMNLLSDPFPRQPQLVLCRNVLIYFSQESKEILFGKFHECLPNGGCLMVGNTEQIFGYRQYGFESAGPFIYRKSTVSNGQREKSACSS
ncbi:MAG: protein-glutamate O-methyltransferase CheR [Synergistales bacterium]